MTTTGPSISTTKLRTKLGTEFQIALVLAANANVSWTGATGRSQVRRSDGTLVFDFGTVNASLDGDGNATLTFTATGTNTNSWPVGMELYVDIWYQTGSYGPRATPTYRLYVDDGPTDVP